MDEPTIRYYRINRTNNGPMYHVTTLSFGEHTVEVTFSPTGRNVHVWVNGECVKSMPAKAEEGK